MERRRKNIAMFLLYRRYKRRKCQAHRRYWVDPINEKRLRLGVTYTFFYELRESEKKFFNYFRMSVHSFDELLVKVQPYLQRKNTCMRDCILPYERLAVTIRYVK